MTATGDVFPCCSPGGFTGPLFLGNLRRSSLADVLRVRDDSLLLQILAGAGPAFFVPFLEETTGRRLSEEGFADKCHLCHTVLSDPLLIPAVHAAVEQLRTELTQLELTLSDLSTTPPRS